MRIAVAGSSGLIGTSLVTRLQSAGHEVVRLVRRPPRSGTEVQWAPGEADLEPDVLAGVDAVVNLAGAGVGDKRWTDEYKQVLVDSRVDATTTLVDAMRGLDTPPRVLVNASAQGFYGARGDEVLTEESAGGEGFLADLCRQWEAAATRAHEATDGGTRVVMIRTGLVMAAGGGAFERLLPLLKLGLAGPLGGGQQWWSWITLEDQVAAMQYLLTADDLAGPVNLCAPHPERQAALTRALGGAFGRPTLLPVPGFALRTVLGEFSSEVLSSIRMSPAKLQAGGFSFRHPDIEAAAAWLAQQA